MSTVNFTVVRADTKNVLDENGTLSSVAVNTPAFEYNTNGTYKGLLVETASENLCLQSEDITTTWTSTNATITTNDTTAPDGAATADKLNDDNSTGTGTVYVAQAITGLTGGEQYTASVFLKADQLNYALVQANGYDGANDAFSYFDLSDGSLGSSNNIDDSRIEQYPNGWYRCSITWTQGAADTDFNLRIFVANSTSNATVDLDGTSSIFVWGAQVEDQPFASSYIPTTTASVTRAKDDISLTGASTYIGQTAGTIYAEVDIQNLKNIAKYILYASESTTASDNRVLLGITTGNNFFYRLNTDDGANEITLSTAATTGTHKLALVYESGDVRAHLDGAQIGSDATSWTFGDTLEEIYIGQTDTAGGQADNWIKAFAFYKRALTDAEAQILTN